MNIREDFIENCRRLCPNVDDYLKNQLYINDLQSEDNVNGAAIFNLVLDMVQQELSVMGIEMLTGGDTYTNLNAIRCVQALRQLFDIEHFSALLRDNTELQGILGALLIADEYDETNLIHEIVSLLRRTYQLSLTYPLLETYMENFENTDRFHLHIESILTEASVQKHASSNAELRPLFIAKVQAYTKELNSKAQLISGGNITTPTGVRATYYGDHVAGIIDDAFLPYYIGADDPNPYYSDVEDSNVVAFRKSCKYFIDFYNKPELVSDLNEETILGIAVMFHRGAWTLEQNATKFKEEMTRVGIDGHAGEDLYLAVKHRFSKLYNTEVS